MARIQRISWLSDTYPIAPARTRATGDEIEYLRASVSRPAPPWSVGGAWARGRRGRVGRRDAGGGVEPPPRHEEIQAGRHEDRVLLAQESKEDVHRQQRRDGRAEGVQAIQHADRLPDVE